MRFILKGMETEPLYTGKPREKLVKLRVSADQQITNIPTQFYPFKSSNFFIIEKNCEICTKYQHTVFILQIAIPNQSASCLIPFKLPLSSKEYKNAREQ